MERLRATNFNHYLGAQRILAAANEICQPGPAHSYPTRFNGDYLNCESMWFTSNPPEKLLTFHLHDVGYIALVSVTVSGGKLEALDAKAATAKQLRRMTGNSPTFLLKIGYRPLNCSFLLCGQLVSITQAFSPLPTCAADAAPRFLESPAARGKNSD